MITPFLGQAALYYLRAKQEITKPKTNISQTVNNESITPRQIDRRQETSIAVPYDDNDGSLEHRLQRLENGNTDIAQLINSALRNGEIFDFLDNAPNLGEDEEQRRILASLAQNHPLIMLTRLDKIQNTELREQLKEIATDTKTILTSIQRTNGRDAFFGYRVKEGRIKDKLAVLDAAEKHPDARKILMKIAEQPLGGNDIGMLARPNGWLFKPHRDPQLIKDFTARIVGAEPRIASRFSHLIPSHMINIHSKAFHDGMRSVATDEPGYFARDAIPLRRLGVQETTIAQMNKLAMMNLDALVQNSKHKRVAQSQSNGFIRKLNDDHNLPDKIRFAPLDSISAEGIIYLIKYGEAEVFTSTFMGLTNSLFAKMNQRGIDMTSFLHEPRLKEATEQTFITAVNYGKSQDILARFPDDISRKTFLSGIMSTMESQLTLNASTFYDVSTGAKIAASVHDCLTKIQDPALQLYMEEQIVSRFNASSDQVIKGAYGLIISSYLTACPDKAKQAPFIGNDVRSDYVLPSTKVLTEDKMFIKNVCTQRIFFYNDDDGASSFSHFLAQYKSNGKAKNGWHIEEHEKFAVIKSTGQYPNGRSLIMIANRPANEEDSQNDISAYIKTNKLTETAVIHRGHSYHADNTTEAVSEKTQLVGDMGCGGYTRLTGYISRAPNAQIFSTQQEATKLVNDPLHFLLNNELLEKGNVEWSRFWPEAIAQIKDQRKIHYRSPHENSVIYFSQSLRAIHDEREQQSKTISHGPVRNKVSGNTTQSDYSPQG